MASTYDELKETVKRPEKEVDLLTECLSVVVESLSSDLGLRMESKNRTNLSKLFLKLDFESKLLNVGRPKEDES